MDRYEANWPMVEQGWRTHVQAIGRRFPSAKAAIETYRAETGCIDQDLPAFVIERSGEPVAKIANGDSVILFNFRGDRAQGISLAFDRKDFDHFDRGDYTGVKFAGMLQYDEQCGYVMSNNFYKCFMNGLSEVYKKENLAKVNKDRPIAIFSGKGPFFIFTATALATDVVISGLSASRRPEWSVNLKISLMEATALVVKYTSRYSIEGVSMRS